MGRPAARVGDPHICPMFDGPKPHVGGPILPPGVPTVWIGGMPAATFTDRCMCASAPDMIIQGSLNVYIGGRMAARVLEPTVHGGRVIFGFMTVMIGDVNSAAAASIFPGQQNYQNCGVQSSNQLIQQATGVLNGELALLNQAVTNNWAANNPNPAGRGGTGPTGRQSILQQNGVASTIINNPTANDIAQALVNRQGVIANVDAGVLWNNPTFLGGGHAIVITDGDWDEHGNLTHVYINDTGANQQGQRIPISNYMAATNAHPAPALNVTSNPIWTQVR